MFIEGEKMNYKIGKSKSHNVDEAILEASEGLKSPKLIVFVSDVTHFEEFSTNLKERFKESIIIGTTSYAEFCNQGVFKDSLLILGIECYGNVLEDAEVYPFKYVERIGECVEKIKDVSNTVCFEISSGLKNCEELVLSTFNAVLSEKNIPVFGGTTGNNGTVEKTLVSFNGQVFDNACVFVIIKNLGGKIRLYKENIYKKTDNYFTATKVDLRNRIVHEYDNKPAAQVISQALNTTVDKLPQYLGNYPLGRIVGDEMYIVANNKIEENDALSYHARIYTNSKVVLLEPDDYKRVLNETISRIKNEIPSPSLSIMINCLARSMFFESTGYIDEFAKNIGNALGDYIGFSGYGEQLNCEHFNQTMVIAVFE